MTRTLHHSESTRLTFIIICTCLFTITGARAQFTENQWNWLQCKTQLDIPPRPVVEETLAPGESYITADHADMIENGPTHLEGNVEITRDDQQVRADIVDYDRNTEIADLKGDVNYWDNEIYMHGDTAHIERNKDAGTFTNVDYRIITNRGRGSAKELYAVADKLTIGKSADFTSCDPGDGFWDLTNDVWRIYARELKLNHETNRGSGKHVVLKIKDIPVFYTPYITFPLNKDRKSGFLAPGFGNSKRNGFEARTPYYWNIAPNMDATITPRLITDSGLMMVGEYRYLLPWGYGHINGEYLPGDSQFNDRDRSYISLEHTQAVTNRGKLYVLFNNLSDRKYLEDFGGSQSITSTSYVERRADLSYLGNNWNVFGRVQDFQISDQTVTTTPYRLLPQVFLNAYSPRRNRELNYDLKSEVAYFDNNDENIVKGLRFDVTPSISYPLETQAAFFKPRVGFRYTMYDLKNYTLSTDDSPDRFLPYFSLDSGAFLERDLSLFNKDYLQSLEPRLYYLYVPEDDQSDLPVFDSGLYDFNYYSMFYENRFSGADRFGDANQVTLAVTSRLFNSGGREMGHVSIGQTYYLRDREVTLPGQIILDETASPILAEVQAYLPHSISLRGDLQWDTNENITRKIAVQVQYRPSAQKVINLAYRVRRTDTGAVFRNFIDIEQTDVSFHWPVTGQLSLVGRWNYALQESKTLDMFGGLEYDSCCWSLRLVGRRFLTGVDTGTGPINDEFQTGFFLQVELKGLAGMGRKTVDFLSQSIPGYTNEF